MSAPMIWTTLAALACGSPSTTDAPPSSSDSGAAGHAGDPSSDTGSAGVEVLTDVAYTPPPGVSDDMATLDLFRVDDGRSRPLVMLVHGGSWVGGDKSNFDTPAPSFVPWWLDRGYVVAAVNFRLASPLGGDLEVGPKDQARDLAHALAWLDDHADDYGVEEGEVVAVGYSSGAHLVALLGADGSYLQEAGLDETHLAATVSLDVHAYDVPYALELMVGSVVEANIPLIEHLFGETAEEQLSASPIRFVQGWVAPAMLVSVEPSPEEEGSHGYITNLATERYAEALQAAGHQAQHLHDSDETHASLATGFGEEGDAVTEAVGAFLDTLP